MENQSRRLPASTQKPALHLAIVILVGQLFVNLPVIMMILLITFFALNHTQELAGFPGLMGSILVGSLIGWLWWSFSLPRWQNWAGKNGALEDQLQKWAVLTGLIWPKGSVPEKEEFGE